MSERLNYAAAFAAIAAGVPERPAIRWRGRTWSYLDVDDRTSRFAAVLHRHGIGGHVRGRRDPSATGQDHIALCLANGNEYLEAMLGAMKARVVPCNVNYRYLAHELAYIFDNSDSTAVVFHSSFATAVGAAVAQSRSPMRLLVQVADDSQNPLPLGRIDYEAALSAAEPATPGNLSGDDRYIVYTGGTTGMPKGVIWSHDDYIAGCLRIVKPDGRRYAISELVERAVGRTSPYRMLPAGPFMHGAAQWVAMSCWLHGGTVVLPDKPAGMDAADILDTIERERCTALQLVGDAFALPLIEEQRRHPRDLSSLRQIVSGGALFSGSAKEALRDLVPDARILDTVGSSESGTIGISSGTGAAFAPTTGCVLSADRARRLAPGSAEVGWLATTAAMPAGYLGDAERTAATFVKIDGTRYGIIGDRARLRADGSIQLLGRDSSCINTGGEKVYAEEVEQALKLNPAVGDCLVVGRPHPLWGNEVVAVVELRDGHRLESVESALRQTAAEQLARYKLPKAFVAATRIRRLENGKPDYRWAAQVATRAACDGSGSAVGQPRP
jgi:fatty-acyl-CoA synthase